MKKLLIISDSGMSVLNGQTVAFGPVVKEVEELLQVFDHITWIGAGQEAKASFIEVPKNGVTTYIVNAPSGHGWSYKVKVLLRYPKLRRLLTREIEKHEYIHVRAPSHSGYLAIRICSKFPKKQFWFKYAGSWVDPAPRFYHFQRKTLKSLPSWCKVTVNGEWPQQPPQVVAFENPCVTKLHREEGKQVMLQKSVAHPQKRDYCFVGGLNENKGIEQVVRAWSHLQDARMGTLHVVGEGPLKPSLLAQAATTKNKIIFHGLMPKEQVHELYAQCHFILLPSKTEGFPKVIGEAMNYSCVPLVSDVSCIGQYVQDGVNGYLIKENSVENIAQLLQESLAEDWEIIHRYNRYNYNLAEKFTYTHYLHRITTEIFKMQ